MQAVSHMSYFLEMVNTWGISIQLSNLWTSVGTLYSTYPV